ncbi:MAG: co-chaperone GroES [Candidatus Marinimicrobia bacterium]|nr:co-chaperone GroES [Candidatus Neomarinimicrobiota bacterium]
MGLKIKPLADRVVIKPMEAEEISAGGIILPDTAKEKPQQGSVVAAGPGKISDTGNLIKMSVKDGDKVLYGKYSGTEVTIDNEEYIIMRENDILAIL